MSFIHLLLFLHALGLSQGIFLTGYDLYTNCNNPALAASIIYHESAFVPNAIHKNKNNTVDLGLFQINSVHGISKQSLLDPHTNIVIGCALLNTYDTQFEKFYSNNSKKNQRYKKMIQKIYEDANNKIKIF